MKHTARQKRLLLALEKRLEALTEGLESIEVQGKGIDLVKEIKELHIMLDTLSGEKPPAEASQPRVIVVWGDSATLPPCGTGKRTVSAQPTSSARAASSAKGTQATKAATTPKARKTTPQSKEAPHA